MELFSLGSFQVKPREKTALRVNAKLIEKFEHHPHIKKIQRHRHVPKHVYNARNELRSGRIAARRKYMRIYFFFICFSIPIFK
jgi:WD repeat and SOF domain-containing protein 1